MASVGNDERSISTMEPIVTSPSVIVVMAASLVTWGPSRGPPKPIFDR